MGRQRDRRDKDRGDRGDRGDRHRDGSRDRYGSQPYRRKPGPQEEDVCYNCDKTGHW